MTMPARNKTGQELINEVSSLRQKIAELERAQACLLKEAEELRKSEGKYRNLVESTLDLIFMVDEKGRYTYVNPRFEKITGYSIDDLIGLPFIHIVARRSSGRR